MRTILALLAAVFLILGISALFLYLSVNYQPLAITELEAVDYTQVQRVTPQIETRIKNELRQKGEAAISATDLNNLILQQIAAKSDNSGDKLVQKMATKIVDGRIKTEALVNLKVLSNQQIPQKFKTYSDLFLTVVPENLMESMYVAFDVLPVNEAGQIRFSENSKVSIGDLQYNVAEYQTAENLAVATKVLTQLGVHDLSIVADKLILKK